LQMSWGKFIFKFIPKILCSIVGHILHGTGAGKPGIGATLSLTVRLLWDPAGIQHWPIPTGRKIWQFIASANPHNCERKKCILSNKKFPILYNRIRQTPLWSPTTLCNSLTYGKWTRWCCNSYKRKHADRTHQIANTYLTYVPVCTVHVFPWNISVLNKLFFLINEIKWKSRKYN
jgi:hypothetical protein